MKNLASVTVFNTI